MKKQKGFTLSEILITLVVIGIIATITIMIITTNIRKTEIETKLKRTVSILNSAMYKATVDYGQPSSWPEVRNASGNYSTKMIKKYFAPYMNTLKPVDKYTLKEIGYNSTTPFKQPNGQPSTNLITDTLQKMYLNDGTIILGIRFNIVNYIFYIDINGPKGPNTFGRDVFELGLNNKDESPYISMAEYYKRSTEIDPKTGELGWEEYPLATYISQCRYNGRFCGTIIQKQGWKITKDYPIKI